MREVSGPVTAGLILGLTLLAGCAGKGETVHLDLKPAPQGNVAEAQKASGERVLVRAFEDLRPDKARLGTRTHLWGGMTHFDVPGGNAGGAIARVVGEYLAQKGRQVKIKVVQPGQPATGDEWAPDVTVTGQVEELSANAKSRVLNTLVTAKLRVIVYGVNSADGSKVRLSLEGEKSKPVFWFDPEDVQALVNELLVESLDKLLSNVQVEKGSWVLKA
jgi:hypothetical protein